MNSQTDVPDDTDWEPNIWPQCAADPECGYGAKKGGLCVVHQAIAACEHVSCFEKLAKAGEQLDLFAHARAS